MGLATVLASDLLKDILIVSKLWNLWIKLLYVSMCRFLCAHIFQLLSLNTKKCDYWIIWQDMFTSVKNYQIVFQRGCVMLQSYQPWIKVTIVPYPTKHLVLSVFQSWVILTGMYLIVWIWISQQYMTWSIFSYPYLYLWIFFGEVCFKVFSPFLISCYLFSYC